MFQLQMHFMLVHSLQNLLLRGFELLLCLPNLLLLNLILAETLVKLLNQVIDLVYPVLAPQSQWRV